MIQIGNKKTDKNWILSCFFFIFILLLKIKNKIMRKVKFIKINPGKSKVYIEGVLVGYVHKMDNLGNSYWYFEKNNQTQIPLNTKPQTLSPQVMGNWKTWVDTKLSTVMEKYSEYLLTF